MRTILDIIPQVYLCSVVLQTALAKADPTMNRPLTKQQQAVYDYIRERMLTRGYGPTVREIGEHMNIKSPNGVMCHLRALERKGMILRAANKSRAIELTAPISRSVEASLSISGKILGGAYLPIAAETESQVDLARLSVATASGAERSLLKVLDDSLTDGHILPGDLLVVEQREFAQSQQLTIVRTGDSETCLRYWLTENGRVRLQPVQRLAPPTIVDQAEVVGVVVGLIRSFETS